MRYRTTIATLILVVAGSVGVALGAQAGQKGDSSLGSHTPQFSERAPRYLLRAQDSFEVTLEFNPELNQTVTVQPDGFVNIRPIGDFHVEGMSVPELTKTLQIAFGKIVQHPSISINLKDFEKPYFIANGHIARPGKYDLRGDTTVTQGIAIAGGFQDGAMSSKVILFRRVSDEWFETKIINIKELEKGKNLNEDVHLRPGDMLFIPKSRFGKIERFIPSAGINMYAQQF